MVLGLLVYFFYQVGFVSYLRKFEENIQVLQSYKKRRKNS